MPGGWHPAVSTQHSVPTVPCRGSLEIPMKSLLGDEEYKKLDGSTIEVKGMLAGLIEKVEADRQAS